jgi:hypothetical protein
MAELAAYQNLIDEIIAKQSVILGPDIALLKARKVSGLEVTETGKVRKINGEPEKVLRALIDVYIELSGEIVRNVLAPIFAKYPNIKV